MGQYRSQPDKTKHTVFAESPRFIYASSGMCGKFTFYIRMETENGRRMHNQS
jgi:hypothetical protein